MTGISFVRDTIRNPFRSFVVFACALLVAGCSLGTFLLVSGASAQVAEAEEGFGADLVVVPEGAERDTKGALLMGVPVQAWMPNSTVDQIRQVPGVAVAAPQLYLASVEGSPYSPDAPLLLFAYDPETDFTLRPWLSGGGDARPGGGEALGGHALRVPTEGEPIVLFGYEFKLVRSLSSTGTIVDRSLFISYATAAQFLERSNLEVERNTSIPRDSSSSVLVRVTPGVAVAEVAEAIEAGIGQVKALSSPDLFALLREQMDGQKAGMFALLAILLVLSCAVLVLVFSMVVNERRREIGVLRALGATRLSVMRSFLGWAAALALAGGIVGLALAVAGLRAFQGSLSGALGYPLVLPAAGDIVALLGLGLGVALVGVLLAAFLPAYRISRQDPAVAMRE